MIFRGLELYNVSELLSHADQSFSMTRIPDALRLRLNESAQRNALQTTGCEARFNLIGEQARIVLQSEERESIVEVYQGSFLSAWHVVQCQPTEILVQLPDNIDALASQSLALGLPFDARLTRVLLPWRPPARLVTIEGEFGLPRPEQTPKGRLLAHGSSITHGNSTLRPSGCYAARTAQFLGMDLINLGFGGGAYLEPEMADYIALRPDWDMATLELGINVIPHIDADEFERRVRYFVPAIARAHPNKWIFCMDLFTCHYDWENPSKIEAFREIVRAQVEALGLPKLVYVPGTTILPTAAGLAADLLHPSPAGMELMAGNLVELIRSTMAT